LPGTGIPQIGVVAVLLGFVGILVQPSLAYLVLPFVAYGLDLAWRHAVALGTIFGLTERHVIELTTFPRKRVTLTDRDALEGVAEDPTALALALAPPARKRPDAGQVIAALFLLWLALLVLSFVHGPSIMGGG
jgi:hypothetical protein